MTSTLDSKPSTKAPDDLWPSHGAKVCKWIEHSLVHGEGDKYGEPFRLRDHDKLFIWNWYEYHPVTKRWRYDAAFRELAKGGAKTEVGAAIAWAEFAGPVATVSPNLPVGAASFEQADLLFGRARQMGTHDRSALAPFVEAFDTEILLKGKQGRMYRIAAEAGTQDGTLPTLFLADEIHEWTGRKERVHLVVTNSLRKRKGGRVLNMSTPGADLDSLAGRLHQKGMRGNDERFLFQWITADESLDLSNAAQLEIAVRQANPWADDEMVDGLCRRFDEVPEHEFRRYYLCQWATVPEEGWLADKPGAWDKCYGPERIAPDGGRTALAIDMSLKHDSTSVSVAQRREDGKIPVSAKIWKAPDGGHIDYLDVVRHVRELAVKLHPETVRYDPRFLEFIAQMLEDEGLPMEEMPQSPERMAPACGITYQAILSRDLVHDGDPLLKEHVEAAARRETDRGWTLSKSKSKRPIDGCISTVMAVDAVLQMSDTAGNDLVLLS